MGIPSQRKFLAFNDGGNESQEADVNPGTVSAVVNGQYDHDLGIVKRRGFAQLHGAVSGTSVVNPGMFPSALLGDGNYLGVRTQNAVMGIDVNNKAMDGVADQRMQHAAALESEFILDVPECSSNSFMALGGGYACLVGSCVDGVGVVVIDLAHRTTVRRFLVTLGGSPTVTPAGVAYLSSKFYIYHTDVPATSLLVTVYDPLTGTSPATATLFNVHTTKGAVSVRSDPSGGVLFAWNQVTTGKLSVGRSTDGTTLAASFNDAGITDSVVPAVVRNTSNNLVHVAYSRDIGGGTSGIALASYLSDLSARTLGPTQVATTGVTYFSVGIEYTKPSTLYIVGNSLTNRQMAYSSITIAHATLNASVNSVLADHWAISAPFAIASSQDAAVTGTEPERAYVAVALIRDADAASANPQFATSFIAMLGAGESTNATTFGGSGRLFNPAYSPFVASMLFQDGTQRTPPTPLPPVVNDAAGSYYLAPARLVGTDAANVYQSRVMAWRNPATAAVGTAPPRVVAGGVQFIAGGVPAVYDGYHYQEGTPLEVPTMPASVGDGAAGEPAAGTYSYCAIWTWQDAFGNVYRSAPSAVLPVTSTGFAKVFSFATHRASAHVFGAGDLVTDTSYNLELYRTTLGGSTFHLQGVTPVPVRSVTLAVTDSTSDAVLAARRILYTNGGVLAAEPPPALSTIVLHQDRLWGISTEDPRQLWHTKVKEDGFGYEWNSSLVVNFASVGTPVALASMDEKLLVISGTDAFIILGEGPTATGSGAFNPPELVARGLGASGRNSIVVTPQGAIIHGRSGFKLLGRDVQTTDLAVAMDTAPGTAVIRAAHHYPDQQQVWFMLGGGATCVVFEYERGRLRYHRHTWGASAALNYDLGEQGGIPVALVRIGSSASDQYYVLKQTTGSWLDFEANAVLSSVTTGWFRPEGDGMADSRFRTLHIYGRCTGTPTSLVVSVALQGEGRNAATLESRTFLAASQSITDPVHLRMRLKRQRGQAAQVTIAQSTSSDLEGFVPFGIEWEFAARGKTARVGATTSKA